MSKKTDGLIPFHKGQSGNPNGRPPKLCNAIKKIPADAKDRIFEVLFRALSLENESEALRYMKSQDLGEYGFILQLAIRELGSKRGWTALNDILDRLFGKARQTAEVTHKGGTQIVINAPDEKTAKELTEIK